MAQNIEKVQASAGYHRGPGFSLPLSSAFSSSEKPLAIPAPPVVAAKWLPPFQPSHPQASPCRRGEGLLVVAPTQGIYFLPFTGPDWVSGDVLTDSNQSGPTSGAGSGLHATETKCWEWEAGGHWQERSWGAGVRRIRPDLSRSSGAQELIRHAGRCPGLLGGLGTGSP